MKRRRGKKISEDRRAIPHRYNTRSSTSRNSGRNPEPIPTDLKFDILLRLPPKSLLRFRCVSKFWESIISSRHFVDSFMTRSLTRPRLLFAVELNRGVFLFSTPQLRNAEEESFSTATFDMFFSSRYYPSKSVYGFICCGAGPWILVRNPSTRQLLRLPKVKSRRSDVFSCFGYDPVGCQYKVLGMTISRVSTVAEEHQVLTLGASKLSWRMIECRAPHVPTTEGLSINGVLYYGAVANSQEPTIISMIVRFDVRSESFDFVKVPKAVLYSTEPTLINYKGKLACLCGTEGILQSASFDLWVLEDAEKYEWLKTVHVKPPSWQGLVEKHKPSFAGTTGAGEIVLAPSLLSEPFYVLYYNLEGRTVRSVEITGVADGEFRRQNGGTYQNISVWTFTDHVENVGFL